MRESEFTHHVLCIKSRITTQEFLCFAMFVMRFTVIDPSGTVSFVAPCNALKALVAACANYPTDLESLLTTSSQYDTDLKDSVLNGLAIFDEHNAQGKYEQIHNMLDYADEQR